MMIPRMDDRWLWLGVSVLTLLAAHGIRYAIQDLVTITKLDPYGYEPKRTKKDDHFEDSTGPNNFMFILEYTFLTVPCQGVPLTELHKIIQSPDPNLANAALALLISRVRRSPAVIESMRKDLRSQNEETRRLATTAFDFMRGWPGDTSEFERSPSRLPYDNFGRGAPRGSVRGDLVANQELARRLQAGGIMTATAEDGPDGEGELIVPSIENPVAGWTDIPRQRPASIADSDGDEIRRRRTRREAMVLHEGSGSIVEEDIFPALNAASQS